MNTTNKQTLRDLKKNLLVNNYQKIVVENANENPVLSLHKKHVSNYTVNYTTEINALRSNPLDKKDITNLKKYANFYKYWLDLKGSTISIEGQKYNIYKVKGNMYFREIKTGAIINATKRFKLAKEMARIKPSEVIMNRIKECELSRNKYKTLHYA